MIKPALANGLLIGIAGEGRIASAVREDYAEAAAAVLTEEEHEGKAYELAGEPAFTLSDLARELSRQSGKEIFYGKLPEVAYAKVLEQTGLPAPVAQAYASVDAAASRGALDGDGAQFKELIGRPTTPLAKVIKNALES